MLGKDPLVPGTVHGPLLDAPPGPEIDQLQRTSRSTEPTGAVVVTARSWVLSCALWLGSSVVVPATVRECPDTSVQAPSDTKSDWASMKICREALLDIGNIAVTPGTSTGASATPDGRASARSS